MVMIWIFGPLVHVVRSFFFFFKGRKRGGPNEPHPRASYRTRRGTRDRHSPNYRIYPRLNTSTTQRSLAIALNDWGITVIMSSPSLHIGHSFSFSGGGGRWTWPDSEGRPPYFPSSRGDIFFSPSSGTRSSRRETLAPILTAPADLDPGSSPFPFVSMD